VAVAGPAGVGALQVWPGLVIDPHELNRGFVDLDKGDRHAVAGTVRLNDDAVPTQGRQQIVNLERNVRRRLDEVWIIRAIPVPLPLNPEWAYSDDR
jgi:hypothetical protein